MLKENWGRHILRWMAPESFMEGIGGNWIKWHENSSFASYMGRVWEWQICLAHIILASMLKMHGKSPDDDDEWWWLKDNESKVEGIQNPWPLTVEMINDSGSFQPLLSVDILIMTPKVVMLLPDSYCRRCWGRYSTQPMNSGLAGIRNIYNHCKSIKEWNVQRRNFVIGDIVLLKTIDVLRNKWLEASDGNQKKSQWIGLKCLPKNWWSAKKRESKKHCWTNCW